MHDNPMGAEPDSAITTWEEDEREQRALLRQVLELHPAALTQDELVGELTGGGTRSFTDLDAIQRAVRGLVGSGLIHRLGEDEMVRPTRAAVRLHDLLER
jgi:hypothetical protein